jgi:ABC-type uncharacterized transport system permease subunit
MECHVSVTPEPPPTTAPTKAPNPPDEPTGAGLFSLILRRQSIVVILVALLGSVLIGAALIRYQGVSPWYAYQTIFKEALLVDGGLTRTLLKTAPLILTGLAVVIPLRVGLFNIGGQGQFVISAAVAGVTAYAARGARFRRLIIGLLVGVLVGAMWASIAALLKTWRGVHEVITTIMLNYIAAGVTWWIVTGPLQSGGLQEHQPASRMTGPIDEAARDGDDRRHPPRVRHRPPWRSLLVDAQRTTLGFKLRHGREEQARRRVCRHQHQPDHPLSMVLRRWPRRPGRRHRGAGVMHHFEPAIGGTLGFDGITIALLARANPIWTIPAALLVGILRTGAAGLQFATGIAPEIVDLLLAITLLLVSIPVLGQVDLPQPGRQGPLPPRRAGGTDMAAWISATTALGHPVRRRHRRWPTPSTS